MSSKDQLLELVEFLHHDQSTLRHVALENLVGYSQGLQTSIFKGDDYQPVKDIQKLSMTNDYRPVGHALKILINLCDDPKILDMMATDEAFVYYVANCVTNLSSPNCDLFCILLVNLGKNDQVTHLMNKKRWKMQPPPPKEPKEGQPPQPEPEVVQLVKDEDVFKSDKLMDCLMDCFVKGADRTLNKYADYDYLAYFFADFSRFKDGRDYFIKQQEYDGVVPITKMLVFTDYKDSKIRRAGVASTIKNAMFDVDSHHTFVFDENVDLLTYLLRPLIAGTDEIDDEEMLELPEELQFCPPEKARDADNNIIATHIESLLLLCTTRKCRDFFREKSVYPAVRELHKNVEDDVVRDPCERLVNMLMRDEEEEEKKKLEEIEGDDDEDEQVVEVL